MNVTVRASRWCRRYDENALVYCSQWHCRSDGPIRWIHIGSVWCHGTYVASVVVVVVAVAELVGLYLPPRCAVLISSYLYILLRCCWSCCCCSSTMGQPIYPAPMPPSPPCTRRARASSFCPTAAHWPSRRSPSCPDSVFSPKILWAP